MRVLHAGCGGSPLPEYFPGQNIEEVRLDIDAQHKPDVVASLTSLGEIGPFDAIYCAHCLEHLYPHEVPLALDEFLRVLKPGGFAMVIVPDLEGLEPSDRELYKTNDGLSVTSFDLFYGHRLLIPNHPFMAHHSGFTAALMRQAMHDAGFAPVHVKRSTDFNLIAVAVKAQELKEAA